MTEKILTAQDILNADDLTREKVFVKEWNGNVYIKLLSMEETQNLAAGMSNGKIRNSELLSKVLCDSTGKLLFNEDQVKELDKKSQKVIVYLVDKAVEINGLAADDPDEAVKN